MSEIKGIIKDLNLPKQLLDKGEAVMKKLFAPSFEELGGLLADQVKMRRFKNQLKIFERAQELLKEKNLNPKQVSLKVLAPLIEYSSYEEDENLQEKWARITVNILENNEDILFHQNCISILNRISTSEARLLDMLYSEVEQRRQDLHDTGRHPRMSKEQYPLEIFTITIYEFAQTNGIDFDKIEFQISNLISLGLIKWETDVEVFNNNKKHEDDKDYFVRVHNNLDIIFTALGYRFLKVCTSD